MIGNGGRDSKYLSQFVTCTLLHAGGSRSAKVIFWGRGTMAHDPAGLARRGAAAFRTSLRSHAETLERILARPLSAPHRENKGGIARWRRETSLPASRHILEMIGYHHKLDQTSIVQRHRSPGRLHKIAHNLGPSRIPVFRGSIDYVIVS